jgi:uncharacterized membrane protein YqjE
MAHEPPSSPTGSGLLAAGLRQFTGLMIEALQARIQLAEHDWRELRAQLLRRGLILALSLLSLGFAAVAVQAWVVVRWWEQAGPAALLVIAALWGLAALSALTLLTLDLKASGWAVVQRR